MSFFVNTLNNIGVECPKIIVETGTYFGDGIKNYLESNYFNKIYSIELSNKYYLRSKELFKQHSNVELIEGDSSVVIKDLVEKSLLEDEPILFYLDAHFSGGDTAGENIFNGCPLLNELESISNRTVKGDVIFIDDMRLMGNAMWDGIDDGGIYPRTYFDFTHVSAENIMKAISKRNIRVIKMCDNVDQLIIVFD
jgi:hypothetical protein